jgi:hypothetical protein
VPTISDIISKAKTLPKLSFKTLDKRKNSLQLQLSAKQESVTTMSDSKTIPEMVKVIKVVKPYKKVLSEKKELEASSSVATRIELVDNNIRNS